MVSVFSSNVNDLHAWNSCSQVLPNFEYLCLNKFCNCAHVVSPKGSKEWYHNLASPNNVRQNLCTLISSSKWGASIQSFECSRYASASSSGFPENSGLKFDQLRCMCLCPTESWRWGYSCPCLWLGMAAPSSLFAITLPYMCIASICPQHDKIIYSVSQIPTCPQHLNLIYLSDDQWQNCSFFHETSNPCMLTYQQFSQNP